ncbi:MAG: DsbE family thiol:disulfide interchange protein [Gammaproteobacteria bacterium]|nr:DsbE family thiol:disulfide interchange protein [Gammaproteobacteria bacterium]
MMRLLIPFGIFIVLIVFLGIGLGLNPREVPSPLINKAAPAFELPTLADAERSIGLEDLKADGVVLFNVWASWCVACRHEHPLLVSLARQNVIPIYGLNYKDERPAALQWLRQLGNPYKASVYDEDGRVGIDWGVYGVPETFVVDGDGIIRHKHTGPLTVEAWETEVLPRIRRLQEGEG